MRNIILSVIFLFGVSVLSVAAQVSPEQEVESARDRFFDVKLRSVEMERIKRDAAKSPVSTESTVAFPKIKEDFEAIQRLNGNVLQSASKKPPTDFSAFLKAAAELNRRAVRLESNIFAAEPKKKTGEDKKQSAADFKEVHSLLADLDKSINRFVHSSIFQNANLVDSTASLKAQADLESIIKISRSIREKTESLNAAGSGK